MTMQRTVKAKTLSFLDQCQGRLISSSSDSGKAISSSWMPATQEKVRLAPNVLACSTVLFSKGMFSGFQEPKSISSSSL